jgi:hypothetical protein
MRLKFTLTFNLLLLLVLLSIAENAFAQSKTKHSKKNNTNITGIWRGYFLQQDKYYDFEKGRFVQDKYKYEVQINNLPTNNLEGVTYSYLNTTFYGKTSLQGIFTTATNNLIIKENKMLELKMSAGSDACLMTCYLSYYKDGDKEYLKGEYSSENMKTKKPCDGGTVYLEKVSTTDFVKEDFLIKKPKSTTTNNTSKRIALNNNTSSIIAKNKTVKLKYKPGAEDALITNNKKETVLQKDTTTIVANTTTEQVNNTPEQKTKQPIELPKVLTERKNNHIKTFFVNEGDITIELYDNGTIDNDIVSVFHNGKPIILHERLSSIPLTAKIHVSANEPIHELIMVADNLGEIPPNTSLMKVTAGSKIYQVFLTSDLQRNAKVIFEYNPTECNKNKK